MTITREEVIAFSLDLPTQVISSADAVYAIANHFYELGRKMQREIDCKVIDLIDDGEAPEYRACQEAIRNNTGDLT